MAQVKALFYIPLKDNDGRDLTTEAEDLRTELYVRFVGWTLTLQEAIYLEVHRQVDVRFIR